MYFAVCKLLFDDEGIATSYDHRELKSLLEKIRSRYPVCIRIADEFHQHGRPGFVIATLHPKQDRLSSQIDSIIEFCENSGFGRVSSEESLLEELESALDDFASS